MKKDADMIDRVMRCGGRGSRTIARIARLGLMAASCLFAVQAGAATPLAVWNGDFDADTTRNGVVFSDGGNIINGDGSVTIKEGATTGISFTLPKSYSYIQAVFTVSGISGTATADAVLVSTYGNGAARGGVYVKSGGLNTGAINGTAAWGTATYDGALTSYADNASEVRTFAVTQVNNANIANGLHLYEIYGGGTDAKIVYGGSGNNGLNYNVDYNIVTIGGFSTEPTSGIGTMEGLTIKSVAVYASNSNWPLDSTGRADFAMPLAYNISASTTISALNTALASAGTTFINITADNVYLTADATQAANVIFPYDTTLTLNDGALATSGGLPVKIDSSVTSVTGSGAILLTGSETLSSSVKTAVKKTDGSWTGTVVLKDGERKGFDPTDFGNADSYLRFISVTGYPGKAVYNSGVPKYELVNGSDGCALNLNNGFSYIGNDGTTCSYTRTPELLGDGTLIANNTASKLLLVVDKWDAFKGTLTLNGKAVWFGVAEEDLPARNTAGQDAVIFSGTIGVGSGKTLSIPATWTVSGVVGAGKVCLAAPSQAMNANFATRAAWSGTVELAAQNTSSSTAVYLAYMGNSGSKVVLKGLSGSSHWLSRRNSGNTANDQSSHTIDTEVQLDGDVTINNGSSDKTYTIKKLSGTGNFTNTFKEYFVFNDVSEYTGTLASSQYNITAGVPTTPAVGVLIAKVDSTNNKVSTTVNVNGSDIGVRGELKTVDAVYGLYVKEATTVGGTQYLRLCDAIDAAEEGTTITLSRNIENETISVDKNITINGAASYQLNAASLNIAAGKTVTFTNFSSQNTIGAITGGGNIATSGNRTFRLKISGTNYTIGEVALGTTQGIRVEGDGTMTVSKLTATASSVLDAYDGAQITIGEVASDSDITVSLKLVNTAAMTKRGSGTLTFAGVAVPTAGFVIEGGSVIIDNSMDGISPYVWVDSSDATTITETDGKVTEWASRVNEHSYTNEASAMTYVAAEGVFGGKKVVRTNNSQLQAEFTGDKVQSAVAAIRYYSNSSTGGILYKKNVSNNYIGKRNAGNNYWSCLRTSSTACNLWQNGGTSDIGFSTYETVLTVAEYYNGSATIEQLGGTSGDIAIAEFVGFNNTDTGCAVRKRTEAYLGNKWSISGMVSLPSSVPLTLAGGTTFGLMGLDRTVDSVTITGTGTVTVTGGKLTITAPVSVTAAQTLVIPYGSTYTLDDSIASTVSEISDETAGTVTIVHKAATIEDDETVVTYPTVKDAILAYTSGTLTIYESADLDFGMTEVNVAEVVLDEGVVLTFTQNAPWTAEYDSDAGTIVNTRVASTYIWTPGENETAWATLSNWRIGAATPIVLPGESDTVQFPSSEEEEFTGWTVVLGSRQTIAAFIANANVAISGAQICSPSYNGTGKLSLGDGAGFYVNAETTIANDLEIVGAVSVTPSATYLTTRINGDLTGTGTLTLGGTRPSHVLSGDNSGFKGTISAPKDGQDRNAIQLTAESASSANAIWDVHSSGADCFTKVESGTFRFGSLRGSVQYADQSNYKYQTIEVGHLGLDDTLGGQWFPDKYRDLVVDSNAGDRINNSNRGHVLRKVGAGTLTFSGKYLRKYEINDGTLVITADTAFFWTKDDSTYRSRFTFGGGTLKFGADVTDGDISARIVSSSTPIKFDTDGRDYTWETALAASNVGGLTKKGSGTLTLSEVPLAKDFPISVEDGSLVVNAGDEWTGFALGEDTKVSINAATHSYTFTHLTAEEKPEAVEGVITLPASMSGYTAVYELAPGQSINCTALSDASGIKAVVTTTVGDESRDITSYYDAASLGANFSNIIKPKLDDSVKPILVSDGSKELMEVTTSGVTLNVDESSLKPGLYYAIGTKDSPTGEATPAREFVQYTGSNYDDLDFTSSLPDGSGSNSVKYYVLEVSDTGTTE